MSRRLLRNGVWGTAYLVAARLLEHYGIIPDVGDWLFPFVLGCWMTEEARAYDERSLLA